MITIVNYGLGNIKAIFTIYKNLNIPVKIADNVSQLVDVSKLILPGVGAFDYAIKKLNNSGMRDKLENLVIDSGIPILGICVGMQMMVDESDEGQLDGLKWVKGRVLHLNKNMPEVNKLDIPHMGWNNINPSKPCDIINGVDNNSYFYFLHSYYLDIHDKENALATTDYGNKFVSAIKYKNIYGVQFHPEKSHQPGIQLLNNFSEL